MTGITTSAGLLSFLAAEMVPVIGLGVLAALGVVVTLAYALVLLPALIAVLPLRPERGTGTDRPNPLLAACANVSARHPWKIVAVTALLAATSVGYATQLVPSADPLAYFEPDHWFRRAMLYIDDRLGGTMTLEVVIDTGRENGLHEPEVLQRMDELRRLVKQYREQGVAVTRTVSILDIAKETHQALNENRSEFYAIPSTRELLAQELLLFENSGSDDLEEVVDSRFSQTRFTVRTPWEDGIEKAKLVERVRPRFREIMGDLAEVEVTGMSAVIGRTVDATTSSLLRSYAVALALITPLMMLLIGSLRAGLISMVPNLVPILMTLGLMAAIGIPLDMFTLLSGCIAIGLAVDDTIHFIAGFRRYMALGGDPIAAIERTMQSTGRALLFTSIVLTAGLLVLLSSSMANLRYLGGLTAFAISMAFLLDVTATPALLVLTHRKR